MGGDLILYKQKKEARRLGTRALAVGVGTVVVSGAIGLLSPVLGTIVGLAGLGVTASQAWKWLQYRGKWGLKF